MSHACLHDQLSLAVGDCLAPGKMRLLLLICLAYVTYLLCFGCLSLLTVLIGLPPVPLCELLLLCPYLPHYHLLSTQ